MSAQTLGSIHISVRYFGAAGAAAGCDSEQLTVRPGATVADVVEELGARNRELARVLRRCSFLCDGIAMRNGTKPLPMGTAIDVLPPFAGG